MTSLCFLKFVLENSSETKFKSSVTDFLYHQSGNISSDVLLKVTVWPRHTSMVNSLPSSVIIHVT
jgi:hypothetical protein